MNYEVGKVYDFTAVGLVLRPGGNQFLKIVDEELNEFMVKPYQFQIEWNEGTKRVKCYLSKIVGNWPRFELARGPILDYWYANHIGRFNTFIIDHKCIDSKTNSPYFQISDCYGITQRFYPNDNDYFDSHEVGDEIELTIDRIHYANEGKNNDHLELSIRRCVDAPEESDPKTNTDPDAGTVIFDEALESIGEENSVTEFKSSIAFLSNGEGPDVAAQLSILMRTIAGFMNKDGGDLYIGVNDAGIPYRDISKDYKYLNTDESDNIVYKENFDHYKLKVLNVLRCKLGDAFANSLVTIEKMHKNGVDFAKIHVEKSGSPIWYDNKALYVRCDNSTRRLLGDAITKYILQKPNLAQPAPPSVVPDPEPVIVGKDEAKSIEVLNKKSESITESVWRYVSFFGDGSWEFRKDVSGDDSCIINVAIPKNPKPYNIVLAYEDGHVNVVELKEVLYGTGAKKNTLIPINVNKKNGLSTECGRLVNAFCCKREDALLVESECDSVVRVKAHLLSDISSRSNFNGAKGQLVIPNGTRLLRVAPLQAGSANLNAIQAMGIMASSYQKYQRNGVRKSKMDGRYVAIIEEIL